MNEGGKQRLSRKQEISIAASLCVLIISVVAGVAWKQHQWASHNPIPAAIRKGLTFPLYYPTNLPAGYSVKPDSFERKDSVLLFYIMTPSNKAIGVSEQALPPGVTLPTTPSTAVKIAGEADFYSASGHSHISLEGANYVSETISPSGTWIILNVNGLTTKDATAVTQSFTAIK